MKASTKRAIAHAIETIAIIIAGVIIAVGCTMIWFL